MYIEYLLTNYRLFTKKFNKEELTSKYVDNRILIVLDRREDLRILKYKSSRLKKLRIEL